jgi:hypothetical protein
MWGAWNDLGVIAFKKQDYIEAERCFKKAKECIGQYSHEIHRKKLEENLRTIEILRNQGKLVTA